MTISDEEIRAALEEEPWLIFYLEDDDVTLDDARVRLTLAQAAAVRELRAHDETIEVRYVRRGLLTTAYVSDREALS
jgi:hypothetical protein